MNSPEIITTIVSIVSLAVAVVSWCISHYVNRRMLAIEEKRERDRYIAENTGKVKVVITRDNQFIITNEGPIDITIQKILLNEVEIRKHPCFADFNPGLIKIPAGCFYSSKIDRKPSMESQFLPPFDVLVEWVTSHGDKQQQEMTVNWI